MKKYLYYLIGAICINTFSFNSFTQVTDSVTDIDGNVYKVVKIRKLLWMAENLKTTRLNDGTKLNLITDSIKWQNTAYKEKKKPLVWIPAYCWYNNDSTKYSNPYGALYNWFAVNSGKLCPTGWKIPGEEWDILLSSYGGSFSKKAGAALKETDTLHWKSPNEGATNESGFTAVPGGCRGEDGVFFGIGKFCYFWTPTSNPKQIWLYQAIYLGYDSGLAGGDSFSPQLGFSVRCIKSAPKD
jgi:uncharacterized protein (TIGR02145 family)